MSEASQPGSVKKLNTNPTTMPGQRDGVRQQVMLEIDREEHDQRAAEDQARGQQERRAVVPPRAGEHQRGERLDNRIADRDRRPAGAAPAAERERSSRPGCSRTTRARGRSADTPTPATRPRRRAAAGRCRRSENCRRSRRTGRRRRAAPRPVTAAAAVRCGSSGSGYSGDAGSTPIAAVRLELVSGTPVGIDRDAAEHPGARRASASRVAALPARAQTARRSAEARRSGRARRAAPAPLRVVALIIRRRATARSTATSAATTAGRRRDASVVAASDRSHHGAPGTSARPGEPLGRPPGSRGPTSSGRTRCPACIPSYRALRANPFSSSAMARSGRPAPPGYGSARKIAPNRYGDVEVRDRASWSGRAADTGAGTARSLRPAARRRLAGRRRCAGACRRSTGWRGSSTRRRPAIGSRATAAAARRRTSGTASPVVRALAVARAETDALSAPAWQRWHRRGQSTTPRCS